MDIEKDKNYHLRRVANSSQQPATQGNVNPEQRNDRFSHPYPQNNSLRPLQQSQESFENNQNREEAEPSPIISSNLGKAEENRYPSNNNQHSSDFERHSRVQINHDKQQRSHNFTQQVESAHENEDGNDNFNNNQIDMPDNYRNNRPKKRVETNYAITYDKNFRPERVQEKSVERIVRPNNVRVPNLAHTQALSNPNRINSHSNNNNRIQPTNNREGTSLNQHKKPSKSGARQKPNAKSFSRYNTESLPSRTFHYNYSHNKTIPYRNNTNNNYNTTSTSAHPSKGKVKQNLNNARFEYKNKSSNKNTNVNNSVVMNNNNNNNLMSSDNSNFVYNYHNFTQNNPQASGTFNNNFSPPTNPINSSVTPYYPTNNINPMSSTMQNQRTPELSRGNFIESNKFNNTTSQENPYVYKDVDNEYNDYDDNTAPYNNYNNYNQVNPMYSNFSIHNPGAYNQKQEDKSYKEYKDELGDRERIREIPKTKLKESLQQLPDESGNSLSSFTPSERTRDFFKREVLTKNNLQETSSMHNYKLKNDRKTESKSYNEGQ